MTGVMCAFAGQKPAAVQRTQITWATYGNAQIDTAQSKFGSASGLFDGNGDYLESTGNNSIWSYDANQDITWECWWRSPTATAPVIGALFNNPGSMMLYLTNVSGNWVYAQWSGSNNYVTSSALTISANTWYHAAFTRQGGTMKLWHNGTEVGTAGGLSGAISASNGALIGNYVNAYWLNAHIDELRISKGICRYTSNFTPSTSAFVNDANTTLLMHFEGSDGSTTFTDDNS